MDIINMIVGYLSSTTIELIIVGILIVMWYGKNSISQLRKRHRNMIRYQQLGGGDQWTFRKYILFKLKRVVVPKRKVRSNYAPKAVPFKTQMRQYWATVNMWRIDWITAIRSYSPRTHMKDINDLRSSVSKYNKQYYEYYDKYNTLINDCELVMQYIDNQIPDTNIKFTDILHVATKEKAENNTNNIDTLDIDTPSTDSIQLGPYA